VRLTRSAPTTASNAATVSSICAGVTGNGARPAAVALYAGIPAANDAHRIALEVFTERGIDASLHS
jgi:hypothetical protein